jgi:hypothetical protein
MFEIFPPKARLAVCCALSWGGGVLLAAAEVPAFFTNSIGMEFVRVEPGVFRLGSGDDFRVLNVGLSNYDCQPAHEVTLTQPFYLLRERVSQEHFAQSHVLGTAADIDWNHAVEFCEWLSRKEGRTYRLPTEAEFGLSKFRSGPSGGVDREWAADWYGLQSSEHVLDPVGPVEGISKVALAELGSHWGGCARFSVPPSASGKPWGFAPLGFRVVLEIEPVRRPSVTPAPFVQAAVKQESVPALQGPSPKQPYFTARFALPIPPENDTQLTGPLAGIDRSVMAHQHSPGFCILPNGDALAIYFSAKDAKGSSESDPGTRFVQARLRFGAEQWDPPELFYDITGYNDQSGLLWNDSGTLRFFGGGRGASEWLPFKMVISTNNGVSWTMSLPLLDFPAHDFTPQPINSAFRAADGAIYFAMDGEKDNSFLWRSTDNGVHWHDMGGRTSARHSTIAPLDDSGHLLSIGGKHVNINGWSPMNLSSDWGTTWSESKPSPFPPLAGNQRPAMIKLSNGHLCFVTDTYDRKSGNTPEGLQIKPGCMVCISTNNGKDWRMKPIPVALPHEADRKCGTLGYASLVQAPNGIIHLLATMTQPCLHYEFNETWVWSDAGDLTPEMTGGRIQGFREKYPNGHTRVTWSARITPGGRYLLHGRETAYYESGGKAHEVLYENGLKTGQETYWAMDGTKIWTWSHHPEKHTSTWTHYWRNGKKRLESVWDTRPKARDLDREFHGLVANGSATHWTEQGKVARVYTFTNGMLEGLDNATPKEVSTRNEEAQPGGAR